MKKIWLSSAAVLALGLAACGTGNEQPEDSTPPAEEPADTEGGTAGNAAVPDSSTEADENMQQNAEETTGTANTAGDSMQEKMDQLTIREIEIDVSYGKDREYEAGIEQDKGRPIEAAVEDELNGVYLKGEEAFDDLYPKVQQLNLTKDSTKEETVEQVLRIFNLESNYEKFEVEIDFTDGSKLDVEDKK